jgi:hypothetical protein
MSPLRFRMLATLAMALCASAALVAGAKAPKGVADLFVACPFLGMTNRMDYQLIFDPKAGAPSERDQAMKRELVSSEPGTLGRLDAITLDEANGYLSITGRESTYTLVLVYYKHPDGRLIPALRFSSNEGEFPDVSWGFYDIQPDGTWIRIPDETILPPDPGALFLGAKPGQGDRDMLAVTSWDIDLPRYGVTAHLVPMPYESDLDDPRQAVRVPGTDRSFTQGDYGKWFRKNFYLGDKPCVLELRWIKANSRFEAGKIVPAGGAG